MLYFKKIDVFSLTSDEWLSYHTFRRSFHVENTPEEPILDDNASEEYIKRDIITSGMEIISFRIFDNSKVIGSFYYGFYEESSESYSGNEKIVRFEIKLLKAHHQLGIATKALQIMLDDCEQRGKSIFISSFQSSYYKPFFVAIGGIIAQTNAESKLNISEIDIPMIENWVREAERLNPETQIIFFENTIPDFLEDAYVRTFNDTLHQIPMDNIESKPNVFTVNSLRIMEKSNKLAGTLSINVLTVEKDGTISGISNVRRYKGSESYFTQGLTGVPKPYRGRKLGKWVKAKMILYLKENYPDVIAIETGNAESNAPMLYINTKLGFKKYKESITGQVYLDSLKSYLSSKSDIIFSKK